MPKNTATPSSSRWRGLGRLFKLLWAIPVTLLAVAAAIALTWAMQSRVPESGQLALPGLDASVIIGRDDATLPHVKAQSEHDAWFAMGWLHASERGWQLAFNRRVVRGTLSERLGPATLNTDKTLRTLGLYRAAKKQFDGLPNETQNALIAYAKGVNTFFADEAQWLTPEFAILGEDPRALARQGTWWTPEDSVGWALVMALDLGGNWGKELRRMQLAARLDTEEVWQLMPPYPGDPPATNADFVKLYRELGLYNASTGSLSQTSNPQQAQRTDWNPVNNWQQQMGVATAAWFDRLGQVEGVGSNNWVVSGKRTNTGAPLLANDPHLSLGAPASWYFAHIQAKSTNGSPNVNAMGATLPGLPFVVLGRTDKVAWGFTNTNPDVQDLYVEAIHPDKPNLYRSGTDYAGQPVWTSFSVKQERIAVKGQEDVMFAVRTSRHGPVISDVGNMPWLNTQRYAIALRWSATDADNQTVHAGFMTNRARSVDELKRYLRYYHSPMQSAVMADVDGNIAYHAIGRTPVRRADNELQGVVPALGWEERFEWASWLPFEENPQDSGDTQGWIGTANQRIHDDNYPHFITSDWTPPYRMNRITQMIAEHGEQHTMETMASMQNDVLSLAALDWLPLLKQVESRHLLHEEAMGLINQFDGRMSIDQAAPSLLNYWVHALAQRVLKPKIGDDLFDRLYQKRQQFQIGLMGILQTQNNNWCGQAGCKDLMQAAWEDTLDALEKEHGGRPSDWLWGQIHMATSSHKPFGSLPILRSLFDVRVPSGGDLYTVNVGSYYVASQPLFANRNAPSLRTIFDLDDLERSRFIYPTGQSGNVFSYTYRDMANEWASGKYRPLRMQAPFVTTLNLNPKE